jgi:DNA-binding NtrC family response regulator
MAKVLVIDDDEVIADLLLSALAEDGHSATSIPSLDGDRPQGFDLVITDLLTASPYTVSDASAWVAEVRRRVPGVPVIVCTAHRAAAKDGDGIAADAVLTKPFDLDALLTLVQRLAPAARS